jgi:hypothetical protein
MKSRTIWLTILIALSLTAIPAQDITHDIDLALELSGLTEAGPPRLLSGNLLLTYDFGRDAADRRIHVVQAAFEHEDFSIRHTFRRNENGIHLLYMPLPENLGTVRYRLIVDGIWTTDPANPTSATDRWGVSLSHFSVPVDPFARVALPRVMEDGMVEFRVRAPGASRVAVAGSFNGWDPFMTPLEEIDSGLFSRTLRLPPGEHLYYFAIDGVRVADPENEEQKWHRNGQMVSVVELP